MTVNDPENENQTKDGNSIQTPLKSLNSDKFWTPSELVSKSPRRSLGDAFLKLSSINKRGIINTLTIRSTTFQSPTKTTGRAGLRSPEKRDIKDLDRSARKRAISKYDHYTSLMMEANDEELDDPLEIQERMLAEKIIKESKQAGTGIKADSYEYYRAYGSDVEMEEDDSEKRTQRRKRSKTKRKIVDNSKTPTSKHHSEGDIRETSEEEDNTSFDDFYGDEEYQISSKENKRGRTVWVKGNNSSSPRKRGRYFNQKEKDDEDSILHNTPLKRKVGRPSKAEKVIGKIKNIFQLDDEAFFNESKQKRNSIHSTSDADYSNEADSFFSINMESNFQSSYENVPIISGIEETQKLNDLYESESETTFKPLEVPKVEQDEEVNDVEFIRKYLGGVNPKQNLKGKMIDERAFFLEGTEGYFEQHAGRPKFGTNSLAQLGAVVEYEEFTPFCEMSRLILLELKRKLVELHKSLYHQWAFELSCGFNLNFYGIGSKEKVILEFVTDYLPDWYEHHFFENDTVPETLVVNGFNPTLKFKTIVNEIITHFIPKEKQKQENIKIPKLISESVPFLIEYANNQRQKDTKDFIRPRLILVVNNIDGQPFRTDRIQSLLSLLCSIPEIWLLSSTDNINVSLLWDLSKLKNFNFLWHDLTTYDTYSIELASRDALAMGKSKKFMGNKGVKYVLSSLTNNAKNLYKLLLTFQIEKLKKVTTIKSSLHGLKGTIRSGIILKDLYNACLEEFITSNEVNFRTLLGEFIEHEMCKLSKDESGTEIVYVAYTYDEMNSLLVNELD